MIGLEQIVVPLIGKNEFGIKSNGIVVPFIATFGAVKAVLNYMMANYLINGGGRMLLLV
jgi:hypothetical protein